jgi:sortase (surface protein transpeptidase)
MPAASRSTRSLLALVLVIGILAVGAPAGAGAVVVSDAGAGSVKPGSRADALEAQPGVAVAAAAALAPGAGVAVLTPAQRAARAAWILRIQPTVPTPNVVAAPASAAAAISKSSASSATSFRGRNHVWIPALGVSRSTTFYACSSSFYPGNRVYRWGCAGMNNIYLFGHAHSVFKTLHDAYVRGRLAKGMKVYYANASGTVSTYAISWWKLTTPDKGAWAYAAQSTPSLTLQTCVGAQSQYRLIVRLRKVG